MLEMKAKLSSRIRSRGRKLGMKVKVSGWGVWLVLLSLWICHLTARKQDMNLGNYWCTSFICREPYTQVAVGIGSSLFSEGEISWVTQFLPVNSRSSFYTWEASFLFWKCRKMSEHEWGFMSFKLPLATKWY